MPVFQGDGTGRPDWCGLAGFEIVMVDGHDRLALEPRGARRRLVVTGGAGWLMLPGGRVQGRPGVVIEPDGGAAIETPEGKALEAVWLWGDWADPTGGCGAFTLDEADKPENRGDPVDYEHRTALDVHYHDCDEYWIIVAGRASVMTEGRHYDVGPGDCVATGMGHHHDIARVSEPLRAVYFETALRRKRRGHLWNHTHGQAEPQMQRV